MNIDQAREIIRRNVKSIRKSRGMTQAELADKAGVAQAYVAQIEGGRTPSLETLVNLAEALNVPPDLLLRAEMFSEVA